MSKSNDRTVLLAVDRQRSALLHLSPQSAKGVAYTPFGLSPIDNNASFLGFSGQIREASTGWYLLGNGARAYNPVLMQFNSPDSLSPFGKGGIHAYRYCGGDSVNRDDPTGHVWQSIRKVIDRFRPERRSNSNEPSTRRDLERRNSGPPPGYTESADPAIDQAIRSEPIPEYQQYPPAQHQIIEYQGGKHVEVYSVLRHQTATEQLASSTPGSRGALHAQHELDRIERSGQPIQTDNGISAAVIAYSIRSSYS